MARFEKTITLVHCARFDQELPALERPPFPGELGERIYENVSALAWSQEFLMEQMEEFFFGEGGQQVDMDPSSAYGAPQKK